MDAALRSTDDGFAPRTAATTAQQGITDDQTPIVIIDDQTPIVAG